MPITYHNVTPTTAEGQGTLFSGMKFWVSQRISNRNEILSKILQNGGQLKKLDKLAQYLIVDPTKDPQPGSYSYEWITKSVSEGIVLPKENFAYAGGTAAPNARAVAAPGRRGIRVAFTAEEDRFLTAWIIKHETKGYHGQGNKVYEKLALKNPRHTWQSWRDHWIKKLSKLPRIAISQEELDAIDTGEPAGASLEPQLTQPSPSASRSVGSGGTQGTGARAKFTPEEDLVLLNRYFEVTNDRSLSKLKDLHGMLAEKYPQHSAAAWADRLRKTIEVKVREKLETTLEDIGVENMPHLVGWLHSVHQDAESFWAAVEQGEAPVIALPEPRCPATPAVKAELAGKPTESPTRAASTTSTESSTTKIASKIHSQVAPKPSQKVTPAVKEAPLIPSSPQPQDPSSPASPQSQRSVSMSPSLPQLPVTYVRTTTTEDEHIDEESRDRAEFYEDYFVYIESTKKKPMHFPTVVGHPFSLWDLWRAVTVQQLPHAQRDWQLVAESLGIDWFERQEAPELLRDFYEKHLVLFEEARKNFDRSDDDDDGDEEATQAVTDPVMPSSPPVIRHAKRSAEAEVQDHSISTTPRKRRRYDRNSEIALTPDDKTGTARLRQPDRSDPLGDDEDHEEDESFGPETQALQYQTAKETQYYDAMETNDDEDITPSQQLELESDSLVPPEETTPSPPQPKTKTNGTASTLPIRGTPTPKQRVAKSPFLTNDDDDDDDEDADREQTPLPAFKKPWEEKAPPAAAKRRSLPKSFAVEQPAASSSTHQPEKSPRPTQQTLPPPPPQTPKSTTPAAQTRKSSTSESVAPSTTRPQPKQLDKQPQQEQKQQQEQQQPDVEEIITHHVSLGFPRDIVLKAMHATTWNSVLSKIVMAELSKGNPIPPNAQGVWTSKDDENLEFVMEMDDGGREPAEGSVTRKKLDKARRKIGKKHTPAMIESRKKWLKQDESSPWKAAR